MRKVFSLFFLSFIFFVSVLPVFAQTTTTSTPPNVKTDCQVEKGKYKLLESVPFVADACTEIKFPEYVSKLYIFCISSIAVASLLMITIGAGYWLLSAGNASVAGTGKAIIKDALLGLVVAFVSYLLLYTLNPDILSGRLSTDGVKVESLQTNTNQTTK